MARKWQKTPEKPYNANPSTRTSNHFQISSISQLWGSAARIGKIFEPIYLFENNLNQVLRRHQIIKCNILSYFIKIIQRRL